MKSLLNLILVFGCLIGIPIVAYHFDNWFFLIGIIFWGVGVNAARWKYRFFILAAISNTYLLISNYTVGSPFMSVLSFCFVCLLIGFVLAFLIMRFSGEYDSLQKLNELKGKANKR